MFDIKGFVNDGTPPTQEQAHELEDQEFRKLKEIYFQRSHDKCGRHALDDQDVIAVRSRILDRGM